MATVIYEFELPNGDILEIEGEEGKQAEAELQAKKYISENRPKELTNKEKTKDFGMSLASGVAKGASYIPGFVGDIEQIGEQYLPSWLTRPLVKIDKEGIDYLPDEKAKQTFPTSQNIQDFVSDYIPPAENVFQYEPKTNLGKYTQTITEFATPGIAGKTKAARKFGTGLGASGGLVYQGSEDLTGSSGAAAGITLPFMFGAGFLARPGTAARVAESSLKSVQADEISKAANLEKRAQELGVKLLPGEVFDDKQIQQLSDFVVKSERGSPYIYEAVKGRGDATRRVAEQQAKNIADAPTSQREIFELIQDVSTQAIKKSKIQRSVTAQQAGYKVSNNESVSPEQVFSVIDEIDIAIASFPKNSPNINKLKQIKNQLIKQKIKKQIIPETNINKLDSVFKQFRDDYQNSQKGVASETRFIDKQLGSKLFNTTGDGILDSLNAELRTNLNYAKANDTFAKLSNDLVNPVIRNVAPLSKNNITLDKINKFVFDPKHSNVKDINKTLGTLNKTDSQATIQIANVYFRNALNRAFPITKQGEDLTQGFNLVKSVIGTGNQRKNFMAVLDNVAQAKGVNPNSLKVGFEKMFNVLERTGRISAINKPGFDAQSLASRTIAKDLAMMKTFNPLVRLATKYGEMKAGGAEAVLGRIFASDEAVENLILLAKTNPGSKKAITRVVNIIALTQQLLPEENPPSEEILENSQ